MNTTLLVINCPENGDHPFFVETTADLESYGGSNRSDCAACAVRQSLVDALLPWLADSKALETAREVKAFIEGTK